MTAHALPLDDELLPSVGTRAGRTAVSRRRSQTRRARRASYVRIFLVVGVLTLAAVIYLGLMANLTRLTYQLESAAQTRATLADESAQLDDTIARLESRERLSQLAIRLRMHEPQTFASVALPAPPRPQPHGLAFLSWLK